MANNRTEAKAVTISSLVATLTLAQLITLWNNELNESYLFRKDIIGSETEAGGNVTIDYSDKDTATVTTAVNLAVTFTNIENGDVKWVEITKNAGNTISFAGAIDVSIRKTFIDVEATLVVYEVKNKNGNIYVNSINIDNDFSNSNTVSIDIGSWNMDTTPGVNVSYTPPTGFLVVGFKAFIRPGTSVGTVTDQLKPLDIANLTTDVVDGNIEWTPGSTQFELNRKTGGGFDQGAYSGTGFNRGYIIVNLKAI